MGNETNRLEDAEIIDRVLGGDIDAFESLLVKHEDHVFAIVRKHVPPEQAEETAHEVFIRAFHSLATYRGKGGFKQWLSSIAIRTCHDYWRQVYRSRELPMSSLTERHQTWLEGVVSDHSGRTFDEKAAQEEARELLDWALEKMSPEDRLVLELMHLEGFSAKETAALTGWTATNVKVRAFRSRRRLEKLLEDVMER